MPCGFRVSILVRRKAQRVAGADVPQRAGQRVDDRKEPQSKRKQPQTNWQLFQGKAVSTTGQRPAQSQGADFSYLPNIIMPEKIIMKLKT